MTKLTVYRCDRCLNDICGGEAHYTLAVTGITGAHQGDRSLDLCGMCVSHLYIWLDHPYATTVMQHESFGKPLVISPGRSRRDHDEP